LKARLRKFLTSLSETFWLIPAVMTLTGILLALGFVWLDASHLIPSRLLDSALLYNGGGTGARILLGAVASSTIGVAGTVFSITIAALSLAAGQMGPRLLLNFVKDRGNQATLGTFLGTFSYALVVLRSVRTQEEGVFVPHLALSFGILLAFISVGTLIYFVGHMASRINVDTVIGLVNDDIRSAIARLTLTEPQQEPPPLETWQGAVPVPDARSGYLQQLDTSGLAKWASEKGLMIHLLVRPGDYVFPGKPIALVKPETEGCGDAIRDATALGELRSSPSDLEFAVRQLVEVAVRALSPGVNDPHTAMSAIDRLGAALCELVPRHLSTGLISQDDHSLVVTRRVDYDGLVDAMFHMIRQNGARSTAVLIRILDTLTSVVSCERDPRRRQTLNRHADLILTAARISIHVPSDLAAIEQRHTAFRIMKDYGPIEHLLAQ